MSAVVSINAFGLIFMLELIRQFRCPLVYYIDLINTVNIVWFKSVRVFQYGN